jgi:hypothetical protein
VPPRKSRVSRRAPRPTADVDTCPECADILDYLRGLPDGGGKDGTAIMEATGLAHGTLYRHLKHLKRRKAVETTRVGKPGAGPELYWLPGRAPGGVKVPDAFLEADI